jgi:hypothetical protein
MKIFCSFALLAVLCPAAWAGRREATLTVLDCESYESSLKSICDLYEATAADVTGFLWAVDLDKEHEKRMTSVSPRDPLTDLFESCFGLPTRAFHQVHWFHLTRVPRGTDFAEGILPLHLVLKTIWQTVISIPTDARTKANLQKLEKKGLPDNFYGLKTQSPTHSGPYAVLVRESAFHARSMGNHNYLAFPEIIEDICNGYQKEFGERIHERIATALKPCIVKFETAEEDGNRLVTPVLSYCWHKVHNQKLGSGTHHDYNAGGIAIPNAAIRRVEFP